MYSTDIISITNLPQLVFFQRPKKEAKKASPHCQPLSILVSFECSVTKVEFICVHSMKHINTTLSPTADLLLNLPKQPKRLWLFKTWDEKTPYQLQIMATTAKGEMSCKDIPNLFITEMQITFSQSVSHYRSPTSIFVAAHLFVAFGNLDSVRQKLDLHA